MTRVRNRKPHLVLRALAVCVFTWLSWTSQARAQAFAPMCDEVGASAIAPLPVVAHARGEIRPGACSPFALLERADAAPGDQEAPKLNLEAQPSWCIVAKAPVHEVRPAALHAELDPTSATPSGIACARGVYRPPR